MTQLPALKVHTNKICPFAVRLHLALRVRKVPYEKVTVSFPIPESFKSMNPLGKIPTLEVLFPGAEKPIFLYESVATVYFVEELEGATGPSLLPKCTVQRAHMRIFMEMCEPFIGAIYKLLRAHKATEEELEVFKKELDRQTSLLESFIKEHGSAEGPHMFGATPCIGDFHIVPFLDRLMAFFPHYRPYTPLENAPRLRALYEAYAQHPDHKDIFLSKEEYIELYAKYVNPE